MKAYYLLAPLGAIAMAGCTTVYRPVEPAVVTTTPPAVAVTPAPGTTVVTPPNTTVLGSPSGSSVIVTPTR